ncbi:hypothetical protein RCL1_003684 [Eukaryota sp. TZLM3-RCL]
MLSVPPAVLRTALLQSLQSFVLDKTNFLHFHIEPLEALFRVQYKFANVSNFFRTMILDVVSQFLIVTKPEFSYPKHSSQLLFLHRMFPDTSFAIKVDTSKSRDFCLEPYVAHCLAFDSDDDIITQDQFKDFLIHNNFSTVKEFTVPERCNISNVFGGSLTGSLPKLQALSFQKLSRHDYESVFTNVQHNIRRLTVGPNGDVAITSLNVSCFVNLESLGVMGSNQSLTSVTGLSTISTVNNLEFTRLKQCEPLCVSARLKFLLLENVSADCFQSLLAQPCCLKQAKITVIDGKYVPMNLSTSFASNVVRYSVSDCRISLDQSLLSFLSKFTALQELALLKVVESNNETSHVTPIPKSIRLDLHFLLGILHLTLMNADSYLLCFLLEKCIYLRKLSLHSTHIKHSSSDDDTLFTNSLSQVSLNYLTVLDFEQVANVYSHLPPMPRLLVMYLECVHDFAFFSLAKSPLLRNLSLEDCRIIPSHSIRNSSLVNLEMIFSEFYDHFAKLDVNFLIGFDVLEHLSLHIDTSLPCVPQLLPPNIKSLQCCFYWSLLKHALLSTSSLKAVAGVLFVTDDDDSDDLNHWLNTLKVTYPNMFWNLSIAVADSDNEVDYGIDFDSDSD